MQAKMVSRIDYHICVGFGTHTSDIDNYVYGKIEKYQDNTKYLKYTLNMNYPWLRKKSNC